MSSGTEKHFFIEICQKHSTWQARKLIYYYCCYNSFQKTILKINHFSNLHNITK